MRGTVYSRKNKLQAKACSTSICMMCVSSHFFADMDISELCDMRINKIDHFGEMISSKSKFLAKYC
jgi:hypothetical protein